MKIAALLLAGSALAALSSGSALAAPTAQNGVCPAVNLVTATDCNVEIFFSAGGAIATIVPNSGPYDGSDDNIVGIINNSGSTIKQLTLSGSSFAGGLFAFDGDGLQNYNPTAGSDTSGYGGKTSSGQFTTFTAISSDETTGTVVFGSNGIANGGTAYFSLEGPPSLNTIVITPPTPTPTPTPPGPSVPEPVSLALLGTGLASLGALRRGRNAR